MLVITPEARKQFVETAMKLIASTSAAVAPIPMSDSRRRRKAKAERLAKVA